MTRLREKDSQICEDIDIRIKATSVLHVGR